MASAVFMLGLAALLALKVEPALATGAALLGFAGVFFLSLVWVAWKWEQRVLTIERLVPDALLHASAFPRGTHAQKIIEHLSNAHYPFLSMEFGQCHHEIERGMPVEEALNGMAWRTPSKALHRAVRLLVLGYKSGADMSLVFSETANDLLETHSILREQNASAVIEKYTLLLAGGLIVPGVLGMLTGMVGNLNATGIELLGIGAEPVQREALLRASVLSTQVYIAVYAFLASVFVGIQEGQPKKGIAYACALVPLSLGVYFFIQWI